MKWNALPDFCKEVLKSGDLAVILSEVYMISVSVPAFAKLGFVVVPQPYGVMYNPDTVPRNYTFGFSRNIF